MSHVKQLENRSQDHRLSLAEQLMRATQERSRVQQGCISYEFAESLDDPGHFIVVSQWRDQAALDSHFRSDAFVEYQTQIGAYLVRSSELSVHAIAASARPTSSAPVAAAEED